MTTKAKTKRRQPLPAAVRDKYKCNDCGVNVLTTGEFYMLDQDIWEKDLGLGWNDNLCIGCLEFSDWSQSCWTSSGLRVHPELSMDVSLVGSNDGSIWICQKRQGRMGAPG